MSENTDLHAIHAFLHCETPQAWLEWACANQSTLLIDHANCEKKAAATAMNLLYRHVERTELLTKMSQLAREELLHFEQVVTLMAGRGIRYVQLGASRYAGALREQMRTDHLGGLIDTLIIGAFVEARSCERFARLAPLLDPELARFYRSLLRSEGRHFEDYLALARLYSPDDIAGRIKEFARLERSLIESPDTAFRFHSGVPARVEASVGSIRHSQPVGSDSDPAFVQAHPVPHRE